MPLPQKPVRRRSRLTLAVTISLIVHAALLPFVAKDANFHMPKVPIRQVVSLMSTPRSQIMHTGGPLSSNPSLQQAPRLPPALKPPPPPEPESVLIPGQVVDLGPTNDLAPEKPTKYLSEHDSRILKETRARETSAFFKNALSKTQKEGRKDKTASGAPAVSEKPGDNGKSGGGVEQKRAKQAAELPSKDRRDPLHVAERPDGTLRSRDSSEAYKGTGKKVAVADPGADGKQSAVGPGEPGAAPGSPGEMKPLKLTLDQPVGALGPMAGGAMPDDLRGVEEGDETLLNSRSFKFAGFLNRVKETVGRVWVQKVQDEAGKRDPSGQLYSYKDRRTVVEFTLDTKGEITDVKVAASSGVPYLEVD